MNRRPEDWSMRMKRWRPSATPQLIGTNGSLFPQDNRSYFTLPHGGEVNALIPEEEAPQEDNLNGSAMVEDSKVSCSDAGVSSTEADPNPCPCEGQRAYPTSGQRSWD